MAPAAMAAMVADLFDDAALFPPASLPLDEAFDDHRTALAGGYRWMLARFVIPRSRLPDLADVATRFGERLRLSVIIDDDATSSLAAMVDEHGWRLEAVEARLRDGDVAAAAGALRSTADDAGATSAYLEVPWGEYPIENVDEVVRTLRTAGVGLKLRCGGATPTDYPQPSLVASLLRCCVRHDVAIKATAGLHHPFRHPDTDTGALAHGFLNLVIGSTLALAGAEEHDLAAVVANERGDDLRVDGDRAVWGDVEVRAAEIARARRELFVAIGSCSFREPVDDLVALGLLPVP
jgi:choline dehydrogenase-like flavoprotein